MRAYPTEYKGIRFRSRLEAKWAWMFDQLCLPWEYEPFELNNYIPDFVIPFKYFGDMLVEIKPVIDHEKENYSEAIAKVMQSGWPNKPVRVGNGCFYDPPGTPIVILGASVYNSPGQYRIERHYLCGIQYDDSIWGCCDWGICHVIRCLDCQRVFFYQSGGERSCRWCNSDQKHYLGGPFDLQSYWAGAKNHFQWKGQK